jgi:hypothetical protein
MPSSWPTAFADAAVKHVADALQRREGEVDHAAGSVRARETLGPRSLVSLEKRVNKRRLKRQLCRRCSNPPKILHEKMLA